MWYGMITQVRDRHAKRFACFVVATAGQQQLKLVMKSTALVAIGTVGAPPTGATSSDALILQ